MSKKKKKYESVQQTLTFDIPDSLSNLEYRREDETSFLLNAGDFANETSQIARSWAIMWKIPTLLTKRGNLTRLHNSVLSFHNDSPYTLVLRASRPYGFADDPCGTAMWETVFRNEFQKHLKPQVTLKTGISFHRDNSEFNIGPKHQIIAAFDYIHLCSFSVRKNPVTDAGVLVPDNTLNTIAGLRVVVTVKYDSTGSVTGEVDDFALRAFMNEQHMSVINPTPPVPISMSQLITTPNKWPVSFGRFSFCTNGTGVLTPIKINFCTDEFKTNWAGDEASSLEILGLDTETTYTIDGPWVLTGRVTYTSSPASGTFPAIVMPPSTSSTYRGLCPVVKANYISYRGSWTARWESSNSVECPEGWYLHCFPFWDRTNAGDLNGAGGFAFSANLIREAAKTTNAAYDTPQPSDYGLLDENFKFYPDTKGKVIPPWHNNLKKFKPKFFKKRVESVSVSRRQLSAVPYADRILKGATIVVSVIKAVVELAGILGLASVDPLVNLETVYNVIENNTFLDDVDCLPDASEMTIV